MFEPTGIKYHFTLLSFLVGVSYFSTLYAQDGRKVNIDSLKSVISLEISDTSRIDALSRLCYEYRSIDTRMGLRYGFKGLEISKNLGYRQGEAKCLLSIGTNYFTSKDFEQAIKYYQESLKINREIGDTNSISLNLSYIAHLFSRESNYPNLLNTLHEILEISRISGDKSKIADELNNIGLVNLYNSTYTQALESLNESLLLNSELNDTLNLGFNLINIGRVYLALGDYENSLDYLFNGLRKFKSVNDTRNILRTYNFISEVHLEKGDINEANKYVDLALSGIPEDNEAKEYTKTLLLKSSLLLDDENYDEAIESTNKALSHSEKILYKDGQAESYHTKGKIYFSRANERTNINDLQKARDNLIKANKLFEEVGELMQRSEVLSLLSKVYEMMKNHNESLKYYKLYAILKDSVFNEENLKQIGKLESDLEYQLKLSESERKRLIAEQEQTLSNKRTQLLIFAVIALLIIISLFLWLLQIRRKSILELEKSYEQIKEQKIELEEKREQLLKMNIAKDKLFGTISHDLRNAFKGFVVGTDNLKNNVPNGLDNEVNVLHQYAKKMNDLLTSLFEYSDKHFNELDIELSKVDVSDIVESVLEQLSNEIKSKKLKVQTDYKYKYARTNPTYLVIAIRNIIHNAIKFSYEKAQIRIKLFTEDNYSILVVSDYGIGMDQEDMEKVNVYQRPSLKSPIGNFDKGNGFGLINSKEIIEKLNGNLFINQNKPFGLAVHIYLPR